MKHGAWDAINGSFEFIGGLLIWQNFRRLLKDKDVKGVSWGVICFFTAWGWWNCAYYPALGQWLSLWGGISLVIGNTFWIVAAAHYLRKKKRDANPQRRRL